MISIIVPALNEEVHLYDCVRNIVIAAQTVKIDPIEVIIVNDGSTDRTADVAAKLEREFSFVWTIHHAKNMGMGASFLDGVAVAKYNRVTYFAGDNNTSLLLIKNLFKNINKAEFVTSFFLNTELRNRKRHLLSMIYGFIYLLIFNIHLKYIHGSSIYSINMIKKIKLNSKKYSMFAELNIKLLKSGVTFYEVAGYMNPDSTKSSAIRLANLVDVVINFIKLFYEIHFMDKKKYSLSPVRIIPD